MSKFGKFGALKMTLSALTSSLALTAVACPDFNGTYQCTAEGLEQTLSVKTEVVNGVHQYSIDETTVMADGVFRLVNFQGGEYEMAAQCVEDSLKLDVKFGGGEGDNPDCGDEAWSLFYTLNWTPQGNSILENHTGAVVCASGKKIPSEDMTGSMTCVKQ